jgi:uncharacterized protein (DUF302 family)
MDTSAVTIKTSRFTYAQTLERLVQAIEGAGNRLFASIDQSQAAHDVAMSLRPTTLLLFGNPKGGTPVMDAWPLATLALPLRIAVWRDGERVCVAYPHMSLLLETLGVPKDEVHGHAMDRALDTLTDGID